MCGKFVSVDYTTQFISASFTQWKVVDIEQADNEMTRLILGLLPANVIRRLKVAPSLIGWVQT